MEGLPGERGRFPGLRMIGSDRRHELRQRCYGELLCLRVVTEGLFQFDLRKQRQTEPIRRLTR